ncbi:MAG TPA: M24 family metallopeptidase [Burkholderiales bacterium]|nr:M24 family metallopeptidase [Burkholderiales bacterium]
MEEIFPKFSEAEYRRREAVVRREMEARGLDAMVIAGDSGGRTANQASVYWLTNWLDPMVNYVVMTRTCGPFLFVSYPLFLHTAKRAARGETIECGALNPGPDIAKRLIDLGHAKGRIGISGVRNIAKGSMLADHRDALVKAMPEAEFVDALEAMVAARMIKSPEEIEWFERGAELTDKVIAHMAQSMEIGMPEYQISTLIHEVVLPEGGNVRLQFFGATPMDAPEIIFPWQYPSNRKLQRGDVLLTEISASWGGCSGQIQRAFAIGAKPTPLYQRLYDVAAECYYRIFEVLKPGATDADVRNAAIFIEKEGFRTLDILIHGWGLQIEPPRVDLPGAMIKRELTPVTFEKGMLIVIQPNIVTADGKAGLQTGNLVLIEENGCRSLQKYPMEFIRVQ